MRTELDSLQHRQVTLSSSCGDVAYGKASVFQTDDAGSIPVIPSVYIKTPWCFALRRFPYAEDLRRKSLTGTDLVPRLLRIRTLQLVTLSRE